MKATIQGKVLRLQSGFYTVLTGEERVVCRIRGRLKRRTFQGDVIAVGDSVQIQRLPDGTGVIEAIEERHSALVRMDPTPRGAYQQILLANPDQIVAVFACAHPTPHLRMLDRFLVIAEKQNLPVVIVANKVDLVGLEKAQEIFQDYPPLGYPVVFTSVESGLGVEELQDRLQNRISALTGPSGVGKSSLLNKIQPGLGLAIREVSQATNRGKHATVVREIFPLDGGGYVADLPGLRRLKLWDTQPEELDGYFPEIRGLVSACQFNDCTHFHEPGCAVRRAVEEGEISEARYWSFIRLRMGEDD